MPRLSPRISEATVLCNTVYFGILSGPTRFITRISTLVLLGRRTSQNAFPNFNSKFHSCNWNMAGDVLVSSHSRMF